MRLEAGGEYTAQVQKFPTGMTAPQGAFTVRNTQQTDVALTAGCASSACARRSWAARFPKSRWRRCAFELLASDGQRFDLAQTGDILRGRPAGGYLCASPDPQMPEGYTLSSEQTVTVVGGENAAGECAAGRIRAADGG